jgi:hypothetical protein
MKKTLLVMLGLVSLIVFQNCSSSKKASKAKTVATVSFEKEVLPIMQASCTPCHFPPGGNKEPLNTYDGVKGHIGEVIARVKLPATDAKYMPFKSKKPALTTEQIAILEEWQKQNMPK